MNSFLRSRFGVTVIAIFTLFASWTLFLTVRGYTTTFFNFLYNFCVAFVYFWGATIAFGGVRKISIRSTIGKMLTFTGVALTLNGLANVTWAYYNIVLKVDVPYPSWADLFFILYYPTIATSFILLLSMFQASITGKRIVEIVGFGVVSLIILFFLLRPELPKSTHITLANALDLLYPVGDAVILALALTGFRVAGNKIRTVLYFFIGSVIVDVVADVAFSLSNNTTYYFNGSYFDLIYIVSALLLTVGTYTIVHNFVDSSAQDTPSLS